MSVIDEIVEKVEKMSVLEVSDLVKRLEEKFGVSAAMPMMAMAKTMDRVETQVAPGENTLGADLDVVFELGR